jgi:DNA-binding CsgD family transcriptional regulator
MSQSENLLSLVKDIYSSVGEPGRWPAALQQVATGMGGAGALFEVVDKQSKTLNGEDSGILSASSRNNYQRHFYAINPRVKFSSRAAEGTIFFDRTIGSEKDLDHDEYYSDFLAPSGLRYFISANLINNSKHRVTFAIQRSKHQGHVDDAHVATMRQLMPHLRAAYDATETLQSHQQKNTELVATLDALSAPALTLSKSGKLLFANQAAEKLLATPDGLSLSGNQLRTARPEEQRSLNKALSAAAALSSGSIALPPLVRISRPKGGALLVRATPLMRTPDRRNEEDQAILLVINEGVHIPDYAVAALIELYDLTPTEANLAVSFAQGSDLKRLATDRDLSLNTIRWHFGTIRTKLGAHSQADIVRIVLGRVNGL